MIFGGLTSTHLWQPDGMTFGDWQSTPANRRLVQPVDELTTTVTPSRGNDPVQPLAEAQTPGVRPPMGFSSAVQEVLDMTVAVRHVADHDHTQVLAWLFDGSVDPEASP